MIRNSLSIGGTDGTTSLETTRFSDRKERAPQSQSQIQTAVARALEPSGCSAASLARKGQYADWRDQPQASAATRSDPQQGPARRNLAEAGKSLAVQSTKARALEVFPHTLEGGVAQFPLPGQCAIFHLDQKFWLEPPGFGLAHLCRKRRRACGKPACSML